MFCHYSSTNHVSIDCDDITGMKCQLSVWVGVWWDMVGVIVIESHHPLHTHTHTHNDNSLPSLHTDAWLHTLDLVRWAPPRRSVGDTNPDLAYKIYHGIPNFTADTQGFCKVTYMIRGSTDLSDEGGRHPTLLAIQLQARGRIVSFKRALCIV